MKVKNIYHLLAIIACAAFLGACAETFERAVFEPDEYYQREALDAGDCPLSGTCPKKYAAISDAYTAPFTGNIAQYIDRDKYKGFWGRIDKDCREVARGKFAGDIDFIGIHAEAGTPLKITVKGALFGLLQPIMTVFDNNGNELAMVASDRLDTNREAMTKIIAPSSDVFYVAIEESKNYELGFLDSCEKAKTIGGQDYGYTLKVEKDVVDIVDLNFIDSAAEQTNRFVERGEIHYYQFAMAEGVTAADVRFLSRGDSGAGDPRLVAIEHKSAQHYIWANYGSSLPQASINISARNAYSDGGTLHFAFVVVDQNSRAGYDYSIKVTAVK